MKPGDVVRLVTLAAICGGSFVFMRVVAPVLGPILTADLRVLIGGAALLIYFWIIRFPMEWKKNAKHYLIVGVLNTAIPFSLFAFAARHLPASYSVILNSSTPLFGAIYAALWLNDPLTFRKTVGLLVGTSGAALVAGVGGAQADELFVLSVLACLGAASCYGLSGVYIKKFATHTTPMGFAGGSQLLAGLALLPLTPFSTIQGSITSSVILSVLGLSLICSSLAFLLYFKLIQDIGPARTMTVTFLMPVFGMLWSALFLKETITWVMLAGCGLIILGTTWVVSQKKPVRSLEPSLR